MNLAAVIRNAVWGVPMLTLLLACGVFLTIRLRALPLTHFSRCLRGVLGRDRPSGKAARAGGVTPLQATATALAATVGTGNIVGVTGAIALGGPGAVFWMELAALFGMATKFSEIALAVRFRQRVDGEWVGGPMYTIRNGLPRFFRPLSILFAALGAAAALGMGTLPQSNAIASSVVGIAGIFSPKSAAHSGALALIAGVVTAVLCALTCLGGAKRVGAAAERLVPLMALVYLLSGLLVIAVNHARLLPALASIFHGAFRPAAVTGGAAGITLRRTLTWGVSRGVFSNEAGLGSAPIAHASAETDSPVREGMLGIFEVFADTVVICTLTALAVLTSGVPIPYGSHAGMEVAGAAFVSVFGPTGGIVINVCMALFALTTVLSWGLYGVRCAGFLLGPRSERPYQLLYCLLTAAGAVMDLGTVWDLTETLNALMAVPNLISLLALSPLTARMVREYETAERRRPFAFSSFPW